MSKKKISLKKYEEHLAIIKEQLRNNYDVIYRSIDTEKGPITVIYITNICNKSFISDYIVKPLVTCENIPENIEKIKNDLIFADDIGFVNDVDHALQLILSGNAVVLFGFIDKMIYCEAEEYTSRNIEEPPTEIVIKGPREGFNEKLSDNISLIRRRIHNPKLKFEKLLIGEQSDTAVVLMYIEDQAPAKVVEFVRNRIQKAKIKFLLESKTLDEALQTKRTIFDTIGYTEKPDKVVAKLTEGRVAILQENTPFAVTAPHFFVEYFSVGEDYYLNGYGQSYFRTVRWVAFFVSLLLPGLYMALIAYHFKLIPYIFAFRMAITRSGVPFPAVVEIMIMMFFFQVLREAGIRLPQPIGSALSIVGALILGDAAIGAGLASEITLLIIALSSISLFLIPKMYAAILLWSNILLLLSALLGLPGFYVGFILFWSHVADLTTCGYPYLYPMGTFKTFNFQDLILRDDLDDISKNIFYKDEK
ncbi:GerA spore germination protein [Anaerovirgula multivorans]|uniref:GerA spore germination protein n=1 Tax=Anaerovirgula multivorans TaxID=312168 RepID=A0A239HMN9_9FIRM|nr:spore germination protein [Anaerovirgula multivorans]SNS82391.1 GerA spore germination protein [Anaerovirgula multivorans]